MYIRLLMRSPEGQVTEIISETFIEPALLDILKLPEEAETLADEGWEYWWEQNEISQEAVQERRETKIEYALIAQQSILIKFDAKLGLAMAYDDKRSLITHVLFQPYKIKDLQAWVDHARPLIWAKVRKLYIGEVDYDLDYAINIRGKRLSQVVSPAFQENDSSINFKFSTVLAKDNNHKTWAL